MSNKIIIADAGPLIAFGKIDLLKLLSKTLGTIIVPETVMDECLIDLAKPGARAIQEAINKKILKIHPVIQDEKFQELFDFLGKGEASAISLAVQLKASVLMDEKLGRNAARKLNLSVIGTAGVLLLAKKNGHIKKILPVIQELKQAGYYLSAELVKEILLRAREAK